MSMKKGGVTTPSDENTILVRVLKRGSELAEKDPENLKNRKGG